MPNLIIGACPLRSESGHARTTAICLLRARSRLVHCSKHRPSDHVVGGTLYGIWEGSLGFDIRGLDDRRPAGNLVLHQRGEWLLTSLCLAWNVAADIEKTPAHVVVVECPVEPIGELVEDRLGHALRRKQGKPRQS